jgi:molecular chaperone IbpA
MVFSNANYHKLLPTTVGFEPLWKELSSINMVDLPKYPPHNVVKTDTGYVLELAVAGWEKDDLDVSVQDHKLTISGCTKNEDNREYNHKGIAQRNFERTFVLGNTVRVVSSELSNGILSVALEKELPDVQKIEILGGSENRMLLAEG